MTLDPNAKYFHLTVRWANRPDDAASVAGRFRCFVDRLIAVDDVLSCWMLGRQYRPYPKVRDDMLAFVRRNVSIGDDEKPDPQDGFSIRGATRDKRQLFSFIGTVGRRNYFRNELLFHTHWGVPADPAIVTYPLMKGVMLATIEAWEPEFCAAYTNDLEPNDQEGWYRRSWMVHVPPAFAGSVDLVGVPFSDTLPNGGLLLSATNRSFDGTDPTHLAGAQRLHEATRHLNATMPPYGRAAT